MVLWHTCAVTVLVTLGMFAAGSRSERLVNPDAYRKGTVFVQCQGCEVWHQLVDNMDLIKEYDLREMPLSEAGKEFENSLRASESNDSSTELHSSDSSFAVGDKGSGSTQQGTSESASSVGESISGSMGSDVSSSTAQTGSTGSVDGVSDS